MRARLRNKTESCAKCGLAFCPHRDFPQYHMREGQTLPDRFYCPQCRPPLARRSVRVDDDVMAALLGLVA